MFDAEKKEKAVTAVSALCLDCKPEEHSDDCPLAKVLTAMKALPTA